MADTPAKDYTDKDFARDIATVFAALLERQEPLGPEFEKVLEDNREQLYER